MPAKLRPFDYLDAQQMVPARPLREAAFLYGVFGGTPRYLATINEGDDLAERVIGTVISRAGRSICSSNV